MQNVRVNSENVSLIESHDYALLRQQNGCRVEHQIQQMTFHCTADWSKVLVSIMLCESFSSLLKEVNSAMETKNIYDSTIKFYRCFIRKLWVAVQKEARQAHIFTWNVFTKRIWELAGVVSFSQNSVSHRFLGTFVSIYAFSFFVHLFLVFPSFFLKWIIYLAIVQTGLPRMLLTFIAAVFIPDPKGRIGPVLLAF